MLRSAGAVLLVLLPVPAAGAENAPALSSFGSICEKAEIWSDLTGDPTVQGVRNIQFGAIGAKIKAQLEDYEGKIKAKKDALASLKPRIEEALKKEQVPYMDEEGTEDLIAKALAPFGSQDKAKATECGNPRKKDENGKRDRSVRGAFNKCLEAFPAVARETLQGQMLFDGDKFHDRFKDLIGMGGYCDQLCQQLRDIAQAESKPPHVTESPKLLNEQAELQKQLQEEEEKHRQCSAAKESIQAFEQTLTERRDVVDVRFKDVMAAEALLYDAEQDLDDLQDSLDESQSELEGVLSQLGSDEKAVAEAKEGVEKLVAEEKALTAALHETAGQLSDISQKLAAAKRADEVVEELRDAVSATTLKMWLFFEASALKPVEDAGLSLWTDLGEYFFKSLAEVPGEGELRQRVSALTSFCAEEAMPAFAAVKDVDLSPLCATGEDSAILQGLHQSLEKRIGQAKATVTHVQSWFDPLKGSQLEEQDVAERRAAGEPEGLREIVAAYSSAKFFQYLKEWLVKGKFLGLIAQLGGIVADLAKSLAKFEEQAKVLKEQQAKTEEARKEAEKKLKEATEAQGVTEQQKAELEKAIAKMQEEAGRLQKQTEDYEEKVRLARQKWEEAQQQLLQAHQAGTSFLTVGPDGDTDNLDG